MNIEASELMGYSPQQLREMATSYFENAENARYLMHRRLEELARQAQKTLAAGEKTIEGWEASGKTARQLADQKERFAR